MSGDCAQWCARWPCKCLPESFEWDRDRVCGIIIDFIERGAPVPVLVTGAMKAVVIASAACGVELDFLLKEFENQARRVYATQRELIDEARKAAD